MTNYNNQDPRNRGVYSNQGDRPLDGQVHSNNPPVSAQTPVQHQPVQPQTTYRDGYYQGRQAERYDEELRARESDSATNGVLIGLLLAALVGLGLGAFFYLNQENRPRIVVPNVAPSASPSPSPRIQERIIERDRVVPVPQTVTPPNVNITVPPAQQPSTQEAPSRQQAPSTQTAPSTDTAPTQSGTTGDSTTNQSGTSGQ